MTLTTNHDGYTEVIQDPILAALLERHVPVSFTVNDDRWHIDDDGTPVRTIHNVTIHEVGDNVK